MRVRSLLFIGVSFILSYGSLQASEQEKSPHSSQLRQGVYINDDTQQGDAKLLAQQLLPSSSIPEQSTSKKRKRKGKKLVEEKSLEPEASDVQQSTSSSTSISTTTVQLKKRKQQSNCLFGDVVRTLRENLPTSMQGKYFKELIKIHKKLNKQNPDLVNFSAFDELIDRYNAVFLENQQDKTLESFNIRLHLISLLNDMLQALDQKSYLKVFGAYAGDTVLNIHHARRKFLQFYVNTLSPVRQIFRGREDSLLPENLDEITRGKFEKDIIAHSINLEKLIALNRTFLGKKADADDYHLFGQAYDALLKALTYDAREESEPSFLLNYRINAVEMYKKMLKCLKEKALPEHLRLIARAYSNLGNEEENMLSYGHRGDLSKATKYHEKAGEYYSNMIELLGTKATVKDYSKAAYSFTDAVDCYQQAMMSKINEDNAEAVKAASMKPADLYSRALPFFLNMVRMMDQESSLSKYFLTSINEIEEFLRKHHYEESADQFKSLIAEMQSKVQTSVLKSSLSQATTSN